MSREPVVAFANLLRNVLEHVFGRVALPIALGAGDAHLVRVAKADQRIDGADAGGDGHFGGSCVNALRMWHCNAARLIVKPMGRGAPAVNFDYTDDQKALKDEARRFLADVAPLAVARGVLENPAEGYDAGAVGADR